MSPPKYVPSATTTTIPSQVLVGAGNIANCGTLNDDATATLLDNIAGTVYTTGDNIYGDGSLTDFQNCYGPSWGRHKARTRPAVGHKDYQAAGAAGYWQYFGAVAGDSGKYYYSYNLGAWHVVVLNSQIDMTVGSAQEQWLKADLAASAKQCTVAIWDQPRFSSTGTSVRSSVKPLWDDLYAAKADIVLNAHYRVYERFAPQTPAGVADATNGIRQFTVGTGGSTIDTFGTPIANSEVRATNLFGVLKLTLADGSYSWQFIPIAGQTFSDTGSGNCHRTTTPSNQPPTANPGGPYTSPGSVTFDGSGSSDPDNNLPLTYAWDFGDGTTGTGVGPVHSYTADGVYTVTLTVTDALGAASAPATTTATIGSSVSVVVVGAGDIASCTSTGDEATATLLDNIAGPVFTIGDNVYPDGSTADFTNCFNPSWGRHKARIHPIPGDHDYVTSGAAGYFGYFGAAAGDPTKGYYSYDLGDWHIVALNSIISNGPTSAEVQWLQQDLAASTKRCTLAYAHHPRFFSTTPSLPPGGVDDYQKAFWDAYYAAGVELVLGGDKHWYERFAPQTPDGVADAVYGIREIIVGTGGEGTEQPTTIRANSEVVNGTTFGVLKLTLSTGSYHWQFVPVAGKTFTDSGSGTCHDKPGSPNTPPTANPGGPYQAEASVTFDGSRSSDPDNNLPLTYAWDFGDGATGTGVAPAHSYTADGNYTVTLRVTDSRGAQSAPATTTATIANVPPTVNAGPDVTVGVAFSLSASFTDPGNDGPWPYTIAWGDGGTTTGTAASSPSPIRASHIYHAAGQYTVRATVMDQRGGSGSDDALVTVANTNVLVGAGDIASCTSTGDEGTATLLDNIAGTVATFGDNAYPEGYAADFSSCYDPSWGRHKARTLPALGNHDYHDNVSLGAADYFNYFGPAAGDPTKGYFSYDVGAWHIVVVNSNIDMTAGSPQEQWLRADLAANPKLCTLAYWHHPRFSSGANHGSSTAPLPLWRALYAAGADIVISGHDHEYERFAPQSPDGYPDATYGVREFVVGTGGKDHDLFATPLPNSEVRDNTSFGVLKLTLGDAGYDWQFVPIAGASFSDAGSGACHGSPPANQAPIANPGGPYSSGGIVTFNGSGSYDLDNNLPLTYAWNFGDGSSGGGSTPTHSYAAAGSYTVTLTVTDALGAVSAPSTATATINAVPVASVDVTPASATIPVGGSVQLTATPRDASGNPVLGQAITWASDNSGVATVNANGLVTAVAAGTADVSATSDGQTGSSAITDTPPPPSVTLVGAGNISNCGTLNDDATASLLDNIAGTVYTTGDNIYGDGSLTDFQNCYGPSWGRHKARTRPAVGHKDYQAAGAAGYWQYFGAVGGDSGKYYYSYDVGAWHVVVLNSQIDMTVGSAQEQWLKADLAATTQRCTVAMWDQPRFSSSGTSVRSAVKPLWDDLYAAGAELVLNAHYRVYERFAPQTPAGVADATNGIRQFTVGTGGMTIDTFGTPIANSEVRATNLFGVLKLTLADGSYSWQFIPIAGQTFTDTGSGTCH